MSELDTAAERAELADPALDSDSMLYVLGKCSQYLDAYDRLRSENQRLGRLIVRDAEGRIVTQGAFNAANASVVRLYEENQRLREKAADLDIEQQLAERLAHLRNEATSVLELMDGLAEKCESVAFRRCRDRLRAAVESTGGGDV